MSNLQVGSLGKLIVALVAMICITVLLAVSKIDQAAGMSAITLILGYILGNGITAVQGKAIPSILEAKEYKAPDADIAG